MEFEKLRVWLQIVVWASSLVVLAWKAGVGARRWLVHRLAAGKAAAPAALPAPAKRPCPKCPPKGGEGS
jgi:hypothetical protein